MATHSAVFAVHPVLAANVVDIVNLSRAASTIEVFCRGTGSIFFTVDETVPTVGGDNTYICLNGGSVEVNVNRDDTNVIKLISSTDSLAYSVTAGS